MNYFNLNGATLKAEMTLRQQAKAIADANGAIVVTVSSHAMERRIRRQYCVMYFYAPVRLGSKSRLFICK